MTSEYKLLNDRRRTLEGGEICSGQSQLSVSGLWSLRNLKTNTRDSSHCTYFVHGTTVTKGPPVVSSAAANQITSRSPSGQLTAVFTSSSVVQIYSSTQQIGSFLLPTKRHGKVYTQERDGNFFSWSEDETHIAYIAEQKREETEKQRKNLWEEEEEDQVDGGGGHGGAKFDMEEDWGEQKTGKKVGRIFILNVSSGEVISVDKEGTLIPHHVSCAEVCWAPRNEGLVFTAIDTMNPSRLGLIYCYNRKSSLYFINNAAIYGEKEDSMKKILPLTKEAATARSPRFSPDGKKLVYLVTGPVQTHNTCSGLYIMDWPKSQGATPRCLIPIVREQNVPYSGFNGIYAGILPRHCWTKDSSKVYFNTLYGALQKWYFFDLNSAELNAGCNTKKLSEVLVDLYDDWVLILKSSPSLPPSLYLKNIATDSKIEVDVADESDNIDCYWTESVSVKESINSSSLAKAKCHNRRVKYAHLPLCKETRIDTSNIEGTIILPKTAGDMNSKIPLIVDIHGGPHGNSIANYRLLYDYLCSLGYAVLTVNYRGSVGYGCDALESLVGRVGYLDIEDVHQTVLHCLRLTKSNSSSSLLFDSTRVFCSGGSHGGFIAAHLIGQYPGFYRSCVLRNPVTNFVSLFFTSDIPDWTCAVNGLGNSSLFTFPDFKRQPIETDEVESNTESIPPANQGELLSFLFEFSPMANELEKIVTPTLLALGQKDRRVPMTEGLQFTKKIRENGVPTRVLLYPEDCHPLDTVEAQADFTVNMARWILQHDVQID